MAPRLKKSSLVWKYFIKCDDGSTQCKLCLKVIKTSGNTSNMMGHLKSVHQKTLTSKNRNIEKESQESEMEEEEPQHKRYKKIQQENAESEDSFSSSSSSRFTKLNVNKQKTISETFENVTSFSKGGNKHNQITDAILYMVCKDCLPLCTVDNEGFKNLMRTIVPLYKPPSRRNFSRILNIKYELLSIKFKEIVKQCDVIVLTTDVWTETYKTESYLGITVHILEGKTMRHATIGVYKLDQSHTADYLKQILEEASQEWEIPIEKVLSITTDNGSNIVKASLDLFGKNKHIRCFAHTLNLVPEKVFENTPNVSQILDKIRSTVKWFKSSVKAADELKKLQISAGIAENETLKAIQDVSTRWNSTFYMVDRYIHLRKHINDILLGASNAPGDLILSKVQYDMVAEIWQLLRPLEAVTKVLSGEQYISISKVIPIIHCLKFQIESINTTSDEATLFKEKLLIEVNKRFGQVESVSHCAVATILDPRYKKLHFEDYIAASRAVELIKNYLNRVKTVTNNNAEVTVINLSNDENKTASNGFDLWDHHKKLVAQAHISQNTAEGSIHAEEFDLLIKAELSQYLKSPVVELDMDPFIFWERNKLVYPNLYTAAKIHLQPSATSVPSERLFSKAGNIVTEKRNRLSAKKLKQMLFLSGLNATEWLEV